MAARGPREIETFVLELDDEGLGRARSDSHQVRVRNALPGETVTVRILRRRRGVWFGEAATPRVPAHQRGVPPCPHYPRCGGCSLQHLDYPAQLEHKQAVLRRALARHGVQPSHERAPIGGPRLHYRYKARLGVRCVGDELLAGFREGFSNRIARIDDCKTLAWPFASMLPELKRTLGHMSQPHRIPQVELAGGDRDFAVVIRHLSELNERDWRLLTEFGDRTDMRVFVQPGGYDSQVPLKHEPDRRLSYSNPDFGLCYEFEPTDFTQVNPHVNRMLVRDALLLLNPAPESRVVDLFCGIGNFALALARRGARVQGLESSAGTVRRARRNATLNGLSSRAEFAVADLYDPRWREVEECDHMLLDPPRAGAGPNLERWAESARPQRIAYVSCSPKSFASDAARLVGQGYELKEAGVYDMFPHTSHVETLGLFVRRRGSRCRG